MRTKLLLKKLMEDIDLDLENIVCFTTNNKLVFSAIKTVQNDLQWYFTKLLNTQLFHVQLQ